MLLVGGLEAPPDHLARKGVDREDWVTGLTHRVLGTQQVSLHANDHTALSGGPFNEDQVPPASSEPLSAHL